jgi:Uma2 family endonuclease
LVVEVISEETRRTDEWEKMEGYLKVNALQLYLLVEPDRPLVIAHRRIGNVFKREAYSGLDTIIPLPFLLTELPLSEISARVNFEKAGE